MHRPKVLSKKNLNAAESARALTAHICKVTMIPPQGIGCVITLDLSKGSSVNQYEMTMSSVPRCTCLFVNKQTYKIDKKGRFMYYNYLYFIFIQIYLRNLYMNFVMHAPNLNFNKIKLLLEFGILTNPIM